MNRKALSILVFITLFSIGFAYLNTVFTSNNTYVYTLEEYKEIAKENTIDILFIGSSHSYTTYNPLIITNKTKMLSYNLGAPNLNIVNTDIILKESLKHNKPQLVVLDVFEGTLKNLKTDEEKGHQLDALDRIPNTSLAKLKSISTIYSPDEYLGVLFPAVRNHHLWNTSISNILNDKEIYTEGYFYNKGYRGYENKLEANMANHYKNFVERSKNKKLPQKISKKAKEHLIKCIEIAKKADANILLIIAPDLRLPFRTHSVAPIIKELAQENGADFLDMNNLYKELKLTTSDFMDTQHLNLQGATKASEYLGEYIEENYTFKRNNVKVIDKYQDDFEDFSEYLNPGKDFYYTQKINITMNDFVTIDSIYVKKNKEKHTLELLLNLSPNKDDWMDKYNIGVKIIPKEHEQINVDALLKAKGLNFDKFDSKLMLEPGKDKYEFNFKTKIKEIEALELFLYDRKAYQGIIGKKALIRNIEFKLQTQEPRTLEE